MRRPAREWPDSPPWTRATRMWVGTVALVALSLLLWKLAEFVSIVVVAVLLAYILNPLIQRLAGATRTGRGPATVTTYAALAIVAILIPILSAPSFVGTVAHTDIPATVNRVLVDVFADLPKQVTLYDRTFDLSPRYAELEAEARQTTAEVFGRASVPWLLGLATDFAFTLFGLLLTFFVSFYIALDAPGIARWLESVVPGDYRPVYRALLRDIEIVWRQFFRGQLILAAMVGALTVLGLLVLGMPYALTLGVIAGVLEVVPRLGPVLATFPAMMVAIVSTSSTLPGLSGIWYAVVVGVLYVGIQQVENNVLVPRVLGTSVNLPPAVVLVAALAGAKLAGVAGILLAAPVVGSARVLGSWLYTQLTRPQASTAATEDSEPTALSSDLSPRLEGPDL